MKKRYITGPEDINIDSDTDKKVTEMIDIAELELKNWKYLPDGTLAYKEYDSTWLGWIKMKCNICNKYYMEYNTVYTGRFHLCPICQVDAEATDLDEIRGELNEL